MIAEPQSVGQDGASASGGMLAPSRTAAPRVCRRLVFAELAQALLVVLKAAMEHLDCSGRGERGQGGSSTGGEGGRLGPLPACRVQMRLQPVNSSCPGCPPRAVPTCAVLHCPQLVHRALDEVLVVGHHEHAALEESQPLQPGSQGRAREPSVHAHPQARAAAEPPRAAQNACRRAASPPAGPARQGEAARAGKRRAWRQQAAGRAAGGVPWGGCQAAGGAAGACLHQRIHCVHVQVVTGLVQQQQVGLGEGDLGRDEGGGRGGTARRRSQRLGQQNGCRHSAQQRELQARQGCGHKCSTIAYWDPCRPVSARLAPPWAHTPPAEPLAQPHGQAATPGRAPGRNPR